MGTSAILSTAVNRVRDKRSKRLRRYFYNRLLPKRRPPRDVAFSVAIGIFIGILPTWGFALLLTIGVLALLRLPKIPGALSSFIAIPPTIFPFFYPVGYTIGYHIFHPIPLGKGFLAEVKDTSIHNILQKFEWFLGTARDHFIAFMVGTAIVALITAIIGGFLTYLVMTKRHAEYRRSRHPA
jgi:uncharacterized protein (DUF2062 family)